VIYRKSSSEALVSGNPGAIGIERRQWHEEVGFLERSQAGSAPTDTIVRKLFGQIARAHQMVGDSQETLRTCARGPAADPDDAELWFRRAVVRRHRGGSAEAERAWRRIQSLRRPSPFSSVDIGIYGHLTWRNLATLAAERRDHAE
jgi:hypothetical protein